MSDEKEFILGTVKWFNSSKGFGFIQPEAHPEVKDDVFVHFAAIESDGYRSLNEGDRVKFTVVKSPKGLQAERVTRLETAGFVGG